MKDVIFGAMVVCLFSGIVTIIAPNGKSGIKKQVGFACAVAVCASLLFPVMSLIGSEISLDITLPSTTDILSGEKAKKAIIEMTVENICAELERRSDELYSIDSPELILTLDESDMSNIKIVSGILYGTGDLEGASKYIEDTLGCKIEWEERNGGA